MLFRSVGMTPEALGLPRCKPAFPSTILPVEEDLDVGFGSDLAHTYVGADRDLILSGETAEEIAAYYEAASAEYHHIGMIGTYPSSSEPDSILPVLNGRVDSEGGSETTANLGVQVLTKATSNRRCRMLSPLLRKS